MHDKIAWIIKHNALVQLLYRKAMSLVFRAIGLFVGIDEGLVLLSSYGGAQYSDSPKAIFEAMLDDPRFASYQYIWAFNDPDKFDVPNARKVKIDTLAYFVTALRSKIWITNVNIERGLHFKRPKQVYLNTWHGTGPKKIGNAVKGRSDYDFSYLDIICVDGKFARDEMVNWFNAKDENLLFSGRPREDELLSFSAEDTIRIRDKLNIPSNKKVILYMPTWREYGNKELDWAYWERELSDEYVVLIRNHHFSKGKSIDLSREFWFDVTLYPNVNELYWISDLLISDYSSAFFDYGLLGRPIICFGYDYDQYESNTGFLMDLRNEFPNGIKSTEEEVIQHIQSMNYEKECELCKQYVDEYVSHPGNATKACIDRLYELL